MKLLDLASKLVSQIYPFQVIEEKLKIIPEPIQRKIIYYSFPQDESYVLMYINNEDFKFSNYILKHVIQIGFHLTGKVQLSNNHHHGCSGGSSSSSSGGITYSVSVNFDRCKITSVTCTCSELKQMIFWCDHVVALALHRIRNADDITLKVPISETLLQMDRSQLQKLIQYMISQHTDILPTAQNLSDELLANGSNKNKIHGAPDPTAGAGKDDDCIWAINEAQMNEQLQDFVNSSFDNDEFVQRLFTKILLMFQTHDSNAPRMLKTITDTFLQLTHERYRQLWDQLSNLWKIAVMNPSEDRYKYRKTLEIFIDRCNMPELNGVKILRPHLQLIDIEYSDIFNEKKELNYDTNTNALRVQALSCHNFKEESQKLALILLDKLRLEKEIELEYGLILFNSLKDTNPDEALEIALISLSQARPLPETAYLQEKHLKNEDNFINLLTYSNSNLIEKYASKILEYNNYANSLPLFSLAKYLYKSITNQGLGFKLAVKFLKNTIPSSYIQTSLELQQTNLALLLISNSKGSKSQLEVILKTIVINIKSVSSIFRLAQECIKIDDNNLLNFSIQLGLHTLKSTLRYNHRKRWDIVRWVMTSSLNCGFYQIIYLLNNWVEYFSPNEAVGTIASTYLNRGTSVRLNLGYLQQKQLAEAARGVALRAMKHDPGNCALNGLTICESDPVSFETGYQIILEAAKNTQLNCQQIFTIARYMEHRGYPLRAYKLAAIAIGMLHIPFNQETHTSISDIHWTCNLAQSLGDQELSNLLPVIISNIKCASVLSEILKRAAMELPPPKKCRSIHEKCYGRLRLLIEATISSYISTIHNRLTHISPRHYADFIEYLAKAKDCFNHHPHGLDQFHQLIGSIKVQYKGKKKLLSLLIERFG